MIRRPPRATQSRSSAASDVYKRQHPQPLDHLDLPRLGPGAAAELLAGGDGNVLGHRVRTSCVSRRGCPALNLLAVNVEVDRQRDRAVDQPSRPSALGGGSSARSGQESPPGKELARRRQTRRTSEDQRFGGGGLLSSSADWLLTRALVSAVPTDSPTAKEGRALRELGSARPSSRCSEPVAALRTRTAARNRPEEGCVANPSGGLHDH